MSTTTHCESCGMSIEAGPYCQYCVGPDGRLQDFDERLARMLQWQRRQHPGQSEAETLQQTLEYMATMPAWKDHPRVTSRSHRSA